MEDNLNYKYNGFCPICEKEVIFSSINNSFRDKLLCPLCINGSVPRERALTLVIKKIMPNWRNLKIHESSPVSRAFAIKLKNECKGYIASQFFSSELLGKIVKGFRNENLEQQTFSNESLDISISLDVFEHVNDPEKAFREIARTIVIGGYCIFTAPTYIKMQTERRAKIHSDGREEILIGQPEYHGNPINSNGALVTFHYGYDLPELIFKWCSMMVEVYRFYDPYHGIIGPMTEVYVCRKLH